MRSLKFVTPVKTVCTIPFMRLKGFKAAALSASRIFENKLPFPRADPTAPKISPLLSDPKMASVV